LTTAEEDATAATSAADALLESYNVAYEAFLDHMGDVDLIEDLPNNRQGEATTLEEAADGFYTQYMTAMEEVYTADALVEELSSRIAARNGAADEASAVETAQEEATRLAGLLVTAREAFEGATADQAAFDAGTSGHADAQAAVDNTEYLFKVARRASLQQDDVLYRAKAAVAKREHNEKFNRNWAALDIEETYFNGILTNQLAKVDLIDRASLAMDFEK
jgi:hypothetical protein